MTKSMTAIAMAAAVAVSMTATPAASWSLVTKWWNAKGKEQLSKAAGPLKKKECWKAKNLFKSNPDDCK